MLRAHCRGMCLSESARLAVQVKGRGLHALTSSAVEVEEAAGGKVHPLLALAVVVQGDLLSLHGESI